MSMPYHVEKGPAFQSLDRFFRDPTNHSIARDRLESGSSLLEVVAGLTSDNVLASVAEEAEHFRRHWLEEFSDHPVEDLIRQSYLQAIAVASGRPITTYWICSGYRFEVYVGDDETHVTVLMLTPKPAPLPPGDMDDPEPLWVVKVPEDSDDVGATDGAPASATSEPVPGIIVKQIHGGRQTTSAP